MAVLWHWDQILSGENGGGGGAGKEGKTWNWAGVEDYLPFSVTHIWYLDGQEQNLKDNFPSLPSMALPLAATKVLPYGLKE